MSRRTRIALAAALAVAAVGLAAWIAQLGRGLVLTDLQNGHFWGLYIAGLAFFVGNAAGGLVVTASIYLFGIRKLKPLGKLGAVTAFANVTAAMLIVVPDLGRPDRLWQMLLHPNFTSPLVWDVIVLSGYTLLTVAYLWILTLPDRARRGWRRAARLADPEATATRRARRLAPFALAFAVGIHVVTAWIFSTQSARGWWNTAAMAPDFIAVAVACGTAIVLLAAVLSYGTGEGIQPAYAALAKLLATALAIHLFLMANDFVVHAYATDSEFHRLLEATWGRHALGHAFEVIAPLAGAGLLLAAGVRRRAWLAGTACLLIVAGVFAHRLLLMPAAQNVIPLAVRPIGAQQGHWAMPIASGRPDVSGSVFLDYWPYAPSAIEWAVFAGVLAYAATVILLAVTKLPIIEREEAR